MKHTKLLVCLPFCAMILAGCSGSDGPVITQDAGISYSSENVDLSKISSGSDYEVEVSDKEVPQTYDAVAKDVVFAKETVINAFENIGLYEVLNEQGYVGFYSSLQNEYLITPHLIPNTYTYQRKTDAHVDGLNFLLELHYKDVYYLYDGFGNFLGDQDDNNIDVPFEASVINSADTETVQGAAGSLYLTIIDENDVEHYWEYDEKGCASHIDRIPDAVQPEEPEYEGPAWGDLFTVGFVLLDSYGLPGYKLVNNGHGYISVFYNDTHVSSFFIGENNVTYLGAVGKFVFFQIKTQLTERAEVYSYSVNNNKYSLETWKVSLENGEKEKLEVSAVFSEIRPFHDEEGNVTCFVATYRKIDPEFKTLGQTTQSVVDHDFVFHNNVSGINFNMKKLSDERFLDANGVLYDKSLKVITYLTYLQNRVVYPNQQVIEGTVEGKHGLVDYDGKVVIEFKYDHIFTEHGKDGNYICVKGQLNDASSVVYRVTSKTGEYIEAELGNELTCWQHDGVINNLFIVKTNDLTYKYFTTTKDIVHVDVEANSLAINERKLLGDEYAYFLRYHSVHEEELVTILDEYHLSSMKGDEFEVQSIPESTKGVERTDTLYNGEYRENAYRLVFGENQIDARNDGYTWVRLDPTEDMVGKRVGIFYHNDPDETSIASCNKVDRNGVEEVYTAMVLEDEIAYDVNMAGEGEDEDIRYTHFRYFVVEEEASYVFRVHTSHQLNYIAFDYVDGINYELQIQAGPAGFGELSRARFTAPTLFTLDKLYFEVGSLTALSHTFTISGHTVEAVGKRVGDEYNMYDGDKLVLTQDDTEEIVLALSEKTVKGEDLVFDVLEPSATKNTTVATAKALTFGENEDIDYNEGRSFVKYTSAVSGRYGFNFLGATSGLHILYSFDSEGNMVDSGIGYVFVKAGGTVFCSYDHTGDAIQAKVNVIAQTYRSMEAIDDSAYAVGSKVSLNVNAYRISAFKFNATENGSFTLFATNPNYVAKYRIGAEGDWKAFAEGFSYTLPVDNEQNPIATDIYVVVEVTDIEEAPVVTAYIDLAAEIPAETPIDVAYRNEKFVGTIASAETKYIRINSAADARNVRLRIESEDENVRYVVSEDRFLDPAAGNLLYGGGSATLSFVNKASHGIYIAISNSTAGTAHISVLLAEEGSSMSVVHTSQDDVNHLFSKVDDNHYAAPALDELEEDDVTGMHVNVASPGTVTFKVNNDSKGTLRVYESHKLPDSYDYSDRALVKTQYTTHGYVLITVNVGNYDTILDIEWTYNNSDFTAKDFSVVISEFTFAY